MHYILLIIGFILLVKGADYFVTGSSNLAKYLKIPSLIIGLTIVSFGTSAPETVISTIASIKGANDMAVSNVIGSNLFNLLIVLGASSLIKPLSTNKKVIKRDYIVMIITSIILLVFMCDKMLNLDSFNEITRSESFVLLLCFLFYLYILIADNNKKKYNQYEYHKLSTIDILMLLSGLVSIILGGELVVRSAKEICLNFGISETLIGLTVVSIGTSLPEFVTSLIAAYKKETDIAIGNVIGSNIYNTLLVIGISGSASEIFVNKYAIMDVIYLIVISIIFYFIIRKSEIINRKIGIGMILAYIVFVFFIINR